MRILLDTHIWLWGIYEPSKIGQRLRKELNDPANELWLSPISTWEALILESKGRIEIDENVALWVAQATSAFREAPVTHEVALAAEQISLAHRDPGDRFLAGTAKVFGLTLATADTKLLGLGDIATIANR
ncbi:MAG TPA: type II toxin-antitoxin system VapC family toxin [Terriglobales bacterium]